MPQSHSATAPTAVPSRALAESSFSHSIKINISDYPNHKNVTQRGAIYSQQLSTAASHNTIVVITPNHDVHTLESVHNKQRFMYNDFTNIIHTAKINTCVREESTSLDAQKLYDSLLDVFRDDCSTTLTSSKLCQELKLMNNTTRESNSILSQDVIDGRPYTLSSSGRATPFI
jgi:hypothetical protein